MLKLLFSLALVLSACGKDSVRYIRENPEFNAFQHIKDTPNAIGRAAQSVVLIKNRGTGFFINDSGLLLTNAHVVGPKNCPQTGCFWEIRRNFQTGSKATRENVFLEPVHINPALDFAAYQLRSVDAGQVGSSVQSPDFLEFSDQAFDDLAGEDLYIVGHPGAALKKASKGRTMSKSGDWFKLSALAIGGNSGSPIVNTEGKLVGILHRTYDGNVSMQRGGFAKESTGTFYNAIQSSLNPSGLALAAADIKNPESIKLALHDSSIEIDTDEFFKNNDVYFRGQKMPSFTPTADDVAQNIWQIYIAGCEASLAAASHRQADTIATELKDRCLRFSSWLNCHEKSKAKFSSCPEESEQKKLLSLARQAADRIHSLNQPLPTWYLARAAFNLEKTDLTAESMGFAAALDFITNHKLPLDYQFASVTLWLGNSDRSTVGGDINLRDFLKNYSQNITSPRELYWVADAAIATYYLDSFSDAAKADTKNLLHKILHEPGISLGTYLDIEELTYDWNLLD